MRFAKTGLLLLVPSAIAFAIACGESSFSVTDIPDGGGNGDSDATVPGEDGSTPGTDGAQPSDDAGLDAGNSADVVEAGEDTSAPPLPDAGCNDLPDQTIGAFVSKQGTATAADCSSPTNPCKTISDALTYANNNNSHTIVYVDQGTYNEQLSLVSGITVEGGWRYTQGTGWKRICDGTQGAAVVVAPSTGNKAVIAQDGRSAAAVLKTLTIQSSAVAGDGQSMYGLFATGGATVHLLGVSVVVPPGGAGSGGGSGATGSAAPGSCSAGNGLTPAAAAPGTGGAVGTFTVSGYTPTAGGAGSTGGQGGNGTLTPPACNGDGGPANCTECVIDPSPPATCSTDTPSTGNCGSPGTPGCGGGGGGGGQPGSGGGCSIGVYAFGATVTMDYATVRSHAGGKGGAGGGGGSGAGGTSGATGAPYACGTGFCSGTVSNCKPTGSVNLAGGVGHSGATGAGGGQGGGGAGGCSYAYYKGSGATVTVGMQVALEPSDGGAPGAGGSPAPATGPAGTSN